MLIKEDRETKRILDEIMFGQNDELINSTEAAKIAGFKNTGSFLSWAKTKGLDPVKREKVQYGRRPRNLYRKSDVLYFAEQRDASKQKTEDTISDVEAIAMLGYKHVASLRELSSKNPGLFKKQVILENGKLKNYYSRENIISIKKLIIDGKFKFRNVRRDIGDDDEDFDPTKRYQDGFVIRSFPLIERQITELTMVLYLSLNTLRKNLCHSTYQD